MRTDRQQPFKSIDLERLEFLQVRLARIREDLLKLEQAIRALDRSRRRSSPRIPRSLGCPLCDSDHLAVGMRTSSAIVAKCLACGSAFLVNPSPLDAAVFAV